MIYIYTRILPVTIFNVDLSRSLYIYILYCTIYI